MHEEVGVLYICTGQYRAYWEKFHETAEKHFLPGHTKHYYVWSDYSIPEAPHVTHIFRQWRGWPFETLHRFHCFLDHRRELSRHKYLYFLNANVEFLSDVGDEVLPDETYDLVAAVHAFFWTPGEKVECKNVVDLLEQRPYSLACVPDASTHDYIMGGFNGGYTEAYLEMARVLKQRIDYDAALGVYAKFNDESHMNHYSMTHPFKLLSPVYLFPDGYKPICVPKVIVRNKMLTPGIHRFRSNPRFPGRGIHTRLERVKKKS